MMLRFSLFCLAVIASAHVAYSDDCFDNKFPNCTDLEDFFGPESVCTGTDCVEGWGGWECPESTFSTDYIHKVIDYPDPAGAGESGYTMYTDDWQNPHLCACGRICDSCTEVTNRCWATSGCDEEASLYISKVTFGGDVCYVP